MTDTIASTLKACHQMVWEARKELEHVWPIPSRTDSLEFAFTELGESVDAEKRQNKTFVRNNEKSLDVLAELGDCALMVITAIGPDDFDEADFAWNVYDYYDKWFGRHEWEIYATDIAELMYWNTHGDFINEGLPLRFLWRIATHPGMDLPTVLRQRLERIKAKRLPVANEHTDALTRALWQHNGELA